MSLFSPSTECDIPPHLLGSSRMVGTTRDEWLVYAAFLETPGGELNLVDLAPPFVQRFVNSDAGRFVRCARLFIEAFAQLADDDEGAAAWAARTGDRLGAIDERAMSDGDCFWPTWIEQVSSV